MQYWIKTIGLAAVLLSSALAPAETACECSGQAQVFAGSQQYVDIRLGTQLQYSGARCRLLEGGLKRLYTRGARAVDQPGYNLLDPGSVWVLQKPPGFPLRFHCSWQRRGTVDVVTWVIE